MFELSIDSINGSIHQISSLFKGKKATMWSRSEAEGIIRSRGVKLNEYDFCQPVNFLDGITWEYRKKMESTYSGPDRITVCIDKHA